MNAKTSPVLPIETRVKRLDISLFDEIDSQTCADDRRSMLAIQEAVSARCPSFTYLEIGSHLGGSIQPFLLDPRCARIVSIDKRPTAQADERGGAGRYPGNSTERMLKNLRSIAKDQVVKVTTFDADSSAVKPSMLPSKVAVCFIDGEHTNAAVERDFAFCESVLTHPGLIYFHDSDIVFQALANIVERLKAAGRSFHAYNLPSSIFVIDLEMNIHGDASIQSLLLNNHLGYLSSLESMAHYRDFYTGWFARTLRKAYSIGPVRIAARTIRNIANR